ncbi:MAG TPA: hypothetical protein VFH03_17765, partial [Actinoplanes sp.]|nr:hypothetical protein [Actinoplanes sp.]
PADDWRPGRGAQLRSLEPEPDDREERTRRLPMADGGPQIPNQRLPRRTPSASSSWTFRDRADQ